MQGDPRVRWPTGLEPSLAPVFSHNELETDVPAATLWSWLLEAPRWHEFYWNCQRLRIVDGSPRLRAGSRFTWWTFGVPVDTTVEVFEEERHLAWTGKGVGSQGYHVWLLDPTPRGGCRIITEETQSGAAVRLLAPVLRRGLLHFHQRWLEGLVSVATQGAPGASPTTR